MSGRASSRGARRSFWPWTLAVALGLLLASELGLRVLTGVDSQWNIRLGANKQHDPVAGFRLKPHYPLAGGRFTNEYGYQAPEHLEHALPEQELRVIYVGDSNSVMPLRANFPLQTEEMLESALGVPVQTVNTAVPGYASQNARQLFEAEVSRFDADHLVVYLGWNDLGQYGPEGLPYKRLERGYRVSPLQRALSNVYSIRFLYAFQRYMSRSEPSFYGPLSAEEVALYDAYEPDHFAENLRAILTLAKRRYPHVYVGSIATITSDDPNEHELATAHYPTGMGKNMKKLHVLVTKYDFVVRELARELGVELLDFHGLFATPEARRHFTDSCHMNTEGARRMARMVSDAIARQERARPSLPRTGTAQAAQAH